MTLQRSVKYNGVDLNYYITDKSGDYEEYGIYVSYGYDNWEVEALSDDIDFIIKLIDELADDYVLPEFVQDICEEAMLEHAYLNIRRKDESKST